MDRNYSALYRKHRPKNFDDIKGQNNIIITLKNIIILNKVSHAFLFSGPRGTGKTSTAKVFASTLNCKYANKSLQPCQKCDFCLENLKGVSLDVIEMDAASNNGVSDIKEIRDNVKYTPTNSKFKVYIIDEIHMLTKGAFNALLKTLEEPPAHVIFILATTEPHKIPATILSRVQRFNFRRVDKNVIEKHLITILEKENIVFDASAINLISKLSNGGMRDALSITDQVLAYSNSCITYKSVLEVFGIISVENQIKIINYASEQDIKSLLFLTSKFIDDGVDITRMSVSVVNIIKDFIIYKKTSQHKLMEMLNINQVETINLTINKAYMMLDEFVELTIELNRSEHPRQAFELAILKILKFNKKSKLLDASQPKTLSNFQKNNISNLSEKVVADKKEDIHGFSVSKLKNTNQTKKLINNKTNVIYSGDQENNESVLLTQKQHISKTDDLFSLFSAKEKAGDQKTRIYSTSDIINLLVQFKKEVHEKNKLLWPLLLSFASISKYNKYAITIHSTKLISSGNNFILLLSKYIDVCSLINEFKTSPIFSEFINESFGAPYNVFAITKEEFQKTKEKYFKLSKTNKLPKPKPIKKLKIKEKEKQQIKKDGIDLFGDIFAP